jgi:sugar phosphate permease
MKENMGMLDSRTESLQATEERARLISEESKRFDQSTKKLLWSYWFKNNLIWIVLGITVAIVVFLIF